MRPNIEQVTAIIDDLEKLYYLYMICDRTEKLEDNNKRKERIKYGLESGITIWDLIRYEKPSKPKKGLRKIKGITITDEEYNEEKEERMALIVQASYEWIEDTRFTESFDEDDING